MKNLIKLLKRRVKLKNKNFKVKSHFELGENLGMLDFELASKLQAQGLCL